MTSRRPRILVVDDEAHIVHVVKLKLERAGWEVHTASDGEEGLAVARQVAPALIIADVQMPCLSGPEMCRAIQSERDVEAPALLLTARGFSLGDDDLAGTGVREVISKPFSPRDVLKRVEALLAEQPPGANPPQSQERLSA